MTTYIDINCDMGESYGRWTLGADEEIMPNITSANIACGFHAGEPWMACSIVDSLHAATSHSVESQCRMSAVVCSRDVPT